MVSIKLFGIICEGRKELLFVPSAKGGGCGHKTRFVNTGRFRVNANGSRLDVWLIYQCEKCKHTYNIPILERVRPEKIAKEDYALFLANDEEFAEKYGKDASFFCKNRLEVDYEEMKFDFVKIQEEDAQGEVLIIDNPCGIKLRPEKLLARVLEISRSRAKKMILQEEAVFRQENQKVIIALKNGKI